MQKCNLDDLIVTSPEASRLPKDQQWYFHLLSCEACRKLHLAQKLKEQDEDDT